MSARAVLLLAACLVGFLGIALAFDRPLIQEALSKERPLGEAETAEVVSTIGKYNAIFQDFYATGGEPTLIDEFPTIKDLKHHTFRDLGYLRDSGLFLVYDLADLKVEEVLATGKDEAEAVVLEQWNYLYQDFETREPKSEMQGMDFRVRYRLRRDDEEWLIESWEREVDSSGF